MDLTDSDYCLNNWLGERAFNLHLKILLGFMRNS